MSYWPQIFKTLRMKIKRLGGETFCFRFCQEPPLKRADEKYTAVIDSGNRRYRSTLSTPVVRLQPANRARPGDGKFTGDWGRSGHPVLLGPS